MATSLDPELTASLWTLYTQGRRSAEARDEHFRRVRHAIAAAATEDLSDLPLCPVPDGLTEAEYSERYDAIGAVFRRLLANGEANRFVIRNYCKFLSELEPQRALEVAERDLVHVAPDDPATYGMMARLRRGLVNRDLSDEQSIDEFRKIMEALRKEVTLRGRDPMTLHYSLLEMAEAAYLANVLDDAKEAAQSCIDEYHGRVGRSLLDAVPARVFHRAHTVLGLIAFDRDDLPAAKTHLLASVRLPAAERDAIDYVALGLARRLLGLGETATVLEFLDELEPRCSACDRPAVDSFRSSMGLHPRTE